MRRFIQLCMTLVLLTFPLVSKALVGKKINYGDTVYSILRKNRFSQSQVNLALKDKILPKSFALSPGKKYFVDTKPESITIQFFDPKSDKIFTYWRNDKSAGSRVEKANYRTLVKTIEGKVVGSLIASINKHVNDKQLAYRFMDAYVFDFTLKNQLKRGDRFEITFEQKYLGKELIKSGEILATSIEVNGELFERDFIQYPEGGAFISVNWNQESRPFYAPANYSRFSSLFSYKRRHPLSGRVKPHLGIDYELPKDAPIYAVAPGRVLRKGKNRGAGNFVVIRHANGYESYYNHLSRIDSEIFNDGFVAAGQVVGYNGCTGYCTKPHLHFAIKKQGKWVNPIKLVKSYPYGKRNYVRKHLALLESEQRPRRF